MAQEMAIWVLVWLLLVSQLNKHTHCGVAALRMKHLSEAWTMDILRQHQHEALRNPGLNKSTTQRMEEAVERSDQRAAHILRSMSSTTSSSNVELAEWRTPMKPMMGEYVMTLRLGTPIAQEFAVIMDTGSDFTWVQCQPCAPCLEAPNKPFDTSRSTSYNEVFCVSPWCQWLHEKRCDVDEGEVCEYGYGYADGATSIGDLSTDALHMEGQDYLQTYIFGCGYKNRGTGLANDGMVGLGRGNLSLTSQLWSMFPNKFYYCLTRFDSAATSKLTIGHVPEHIGIQYTPMVAIPPGKPHYYYVQLISIRVGGHSLDINPFMFGFDANGRGGTIFDSGTNLSYLNEIAFEAVVEAYKDQVQLPVIYNYGHLTMPFCFDIRPNPRPMLPDLMFKFADADFYVRAENVFIYMDQTTICMAMKPVPSMEVGVIGNIMQQDMLVVYDNVDSKIGFTEWDCRYPR